MNKQVTIITGEFEPDPNFSVDPEFVPDPEFGVEPEEQLEETSPYPLKTKNIHLPPVPEPPPLPPPTPEEEKSLPPEKPPKYKEDGIFHYFRIRGFYDRVRSLLSTASTVTITDEQMDMPEKAPMAEYMIKKLVPNWRELEKDKDRKEEFEIFQTCIVIQTAIFFEGYIIANQPKRMQTSSLNIEYNSAQNVGKGLSLKDMLDELLTELDEEEFEGFNTFTVT